MEKHIIVFGNLNLTEIYGKLDAGATNPKIAPREFSGLDDFLEWLNNQ